MQPVLAEFQVGQLVWSMLWFTMFFMWVALAVHIFSDIFRSPDLGGFAKVVWMFFVIVLPFLGSFSYLIARGDEMGQRDIARAEAHDEATRRYVREAAGLSSDVADLQRLVDLRDSGAIDEAEYQSMKVKVFSTARPA